MPRHRVRSAQEQTQPESSTSTTTTRVHVAKRALLVAVQTPQQSDAHHARSLQELSHLAMGLGFDIAGVVTQKRATPDPVTYVGPGKVRELAARTGGSGVWTFGELAEAASTTTAIDSEANAPAIGGTIDIVIADDELTPAQGRHLQAALDVDVIDRVDVILRVFAARAQSTETKLEVEIAELEHALPRIRDDKTIGDREGGGGRASRGHSNVELAKQRTRARIADLRRSLDKRALQATQQRALHGDPHVALVGYTNAGKSSLMRKLTGSDVYVEDKLFATLGATHRKLSPPSTMPVVVVDTVGFLHRLPQTLMASFRSTLSAARDAALILHVVDVADAEFALQMATTDAVLAEIGATDAPTWLVFNKADQLSDEARADIAQRHPEALLVSALDDDDIRELHRRICAHVQAEAQKNVETRVFVVPHERQHIVQTFGNQLKIVDADYREVAHLTIRGQPDVLDRLHQRLNARG